jgi:tetratricopeptide (TPR) repeat protein
MNRGELDKALADFDRALAIDPIMAGAYADRGRAYELKGDRDQAIADYRKALSLKSRQLYDDKAKAEAKKHLAALGAAVSDSALPNSRADQAANPKEPNALSASP